MYHTPPEREKERERNRKEGGREERVKWKEYGDEGRKEGGRKEGGEETVSCLAQRQNGWWNSDLL